MVSNVQIWYIDVDVDVDIDDTPL